MLTPQQISDHIEIAQLIQRYGMALDENRYELLDSVFTPDAFLHYEMVDQKTQGPYPMWRKLFASFLEPFYWTQHVFSDPIIELHGDRATSTCRLIATHVQILRDPATSDQGPSDQKRNTWTVWGTYHDTLERTPSGWRIRERHFSSPHTEGEALPADRVTARRDPTV